MKYPFKFILPSDNYSKVSIESDNFPEGIVKDLTYCSVNNVFMSTIFLPEGVYSYQFNADGKIISDSLRTDSGREAILVVGSLENQGVIFDQDKIFIRDNQLILTIGLDINMWSSTDLMIQTLTGMQVMKGQSVFVEGSYDYYTFAVDVSQDVSLFAFFELYGYRENKFYGANGVQNSEWSVKIFEMNIEDYNIAAKSDIVGVYYLSDSSVEQFEKHIDYFDSFPINYISGNISEHSVLRKRFSYFSESEHVVLDSLLRDIFLEKEDFNPALGLLGRFSYEYGQKIANIPFLLSNFRDPFWDMINCNCSVIKLAVGIQLLITMVPGILFGEEIGISNSNKDRKMMWTRLKWNKNLFNFYQKLLKLRKKYPVLRHGNFRFVIQDGQFVGIERYMSGEESIYIFANFSQNKIIIDLTQIMNFSGPIIELISDNPVKRKKVCAVFGESLVVFKSNSTKNIKKIDVISKEFPGDVEQEDDGY